MTDEEYKEWFTENVLGSDLEAIELYKQKCLDIKAKYPKV